MTLLLTPVRSDAGPQLVDPARRGRVYAIPVPTTLLLRDALSRVDWSDAYAVLIPAGAPGHHPQEWADAVFAQPPPWIRALFGLREVVVRAVGIEPGSAQAFATRSWRPDEVLLGTDQEHLSFRASVLVSHDRVVVSTIVQLNNRRGRAYSALVRRLHPWVVRSMLARAARELAVAS
ncbi:conserved hypothetical protein [metagenome]|uniref:DUF2867 domain-containing protein n=1 Tax=metagenome TaxID=256318 RepID=A0A2P2C2E8_9ZZZZ